MHDVAWDRLVDPFPVSAVRWHVRAADPDGTRARLAPHLAFDALRERLDAVAGPEGWSFRMSGWGAAGIVGELTIGSAVRAGAVADAPRRGHRFGGSDGEVGPDTDSEHGAIRDDDAPDEDAPDDDDAVPGGAVRAIAATAAAASFGVGVPLRIVDDGWVAAVPSDEGDGVEPLHPPATRPRATGDGDRSGQDRTSPGPDAARAANGGVAAGTADASDREDARSEPERMIDRLVERLREEGLGAPAARLVTSYGGYGRDLEERRELYAKLRSLLVERSATE